MVPAAPAAPAYLLLIGVASVWRGGAGAVQVSVQQGRLQGAEVALVTGDGTYYSFKGIPYAQPPVGTLRFKAPQAPTKWEGVRPALEHGAQCYQFDTIANSLNNGSEDCLFLNVYTPPNLTPAKPYPVMVWIFPGAWTFGSGDSTSYSPDFLVPHGVIVVTFNHRLDTLGFLSLQNEEVPGNNGLKDQVAVLRWVKKNIASFGGNPNDVCLFGISSGGASVGFHMFSPMSKGLFHKAILQSGNPIMGLANVIYPRERAFHLGASLGLNTTDDKELLEFLRKAPIIDLVRKKLPVMAWETLGNWVKVNSFSPVIETVVGMEEQFLGKSVEEYLKAGVIPTDVPVIMGRTSQEGMFAYAQYSTQLDVINQFDDYFLNRPLAYCTSAVQGLEIAKMIKKRYISEDFVSNTTRSNLDMIKYYSWSEIDYDVQKFLNYMSQSKHNKYFYYFSVSTERNIFRTIFGPPTPIEGTSHADDANYLFHSAAVPLNTSSTSYLKVQQYTTLWTNFAKYGNPTPDDCLGVIWKPWTPAEQSYLAITNEALALERELELDEWSFWDELYSHIHK